MIAVFEVKTPKLVTLQHASALASFRNETQKVEVVGDLKEDCYMFH